MLIDMSFKYRIALAKFRSSNHTFGIETDRHNNIDRELRICIYCFRKLIQKSIVECECHVLFPCQKFDKLRTVILFNWYAGDTNSIDDMFTLLQKRQS